MKHEEEVRMLDQLEDALVRAETAHKDLDLLVVMRVVYKLLEDRVKHGGKQ